jgi:hypothetical protein
MKINAIKEALETAKLIRKNLGWLAIAAVTDVFFFLVYGFLTRPVRDKIIEHIVIIGGKLSQLATETIKTSYFKLLWTESVKPYTTQMLFLLLIFLIMVWVLYCVFQGTTWWICRTIAGKKEAYQKYLITFTKLNIVWGLLFVIYLALDTYVDLKNALLKAVTQQPAGQSILLIIYLIIVIYFALISYSTGKLRNIFKTGKNLKQTIPPMLLSFVLILIIHFIVKLAGMINAIAALIIGILLILPALTFIKTHLVRTLKA